MNFGYEVATSGLADTLTAQLHTAVSNALRDTVDIVKMEWEQTAKTKLRTAYLDYYTSLNRPDSVQFPDPFTAIITMKGKWANMLETGFPAFDMKKGFARSEKAKRTKDGGWYLTIPFRHLTPGAIGVNGGQPMPTDIYKQAKQLRPGERLTGTEKNYPPQVSWKGYQHKAGIYENMVRNVKQYGQSGAAQGTYYTFRRVSDKTDPMAFWHPGYEGVHALDHIRPFAEQWLQTTLMYYLADLG